MSQTSGNAYTDTPSLHPNLFVGSFQLLVWIVFHPSAWQNHITQIDPTLPANFCLAHLSQTHWRQPSIRRLLLMGYMIWPVLICLTISLLLWILGTKSETLINSVGYGLAAGLAGALIIGVLVNFAASIFVGIGAFIVLSIVVTITTSQTAEDMAAVGFVVAISLIVGLLGGTLSSLESHNSVRSLNQSVSGMVIGLLGILIFAVLGVMVLGDPDSGRVPDVTRSLPNGMVVSGGVGLMLGLAGYWRKQQVHYGLAFGVGGGLIFTMASVIGYSFPNEVIAFMGKGAAGAVYTCAAFGLLCALTNRFIGSEVAVIVGAVGIGLGYTIFRVIIDGQIFLLLSVGLICLVLGLTMTWCLSILLYPFILTWNTLLFYADERNTHDQPGLLRWHSAFWDEHQRLRLFGLEHHLILITERNPAEGQAALHYLTITGRQYWAAEAAQIELYARQLESCAIISAVGQISDALPINELTDPANILLNTFKRHSQDIKTALNHGVPYYQRIELNAIEKQLDNLQRELTLSGEPYAVRFYRVARCWHQIVATYGQELLKTAELNQEIDNPYIFGIPLTEQQEIFIGRTDIVTQIEQLLLDQQRPPLLLYGQRRMGKTSLLHNLRRLLPSTIVPFFVDGEVISGMSDYADFLYNVARQISRSAQLRRLNLPQLSLAQLRDSPFTSFNEWLDELELCLKNNGYRMALLTLDEFEALDNVQQKDRFDERDVLRLLRHLVQHRPQFKLLLAGSHTLDELRHWAGYLINTQVLKISYLEQDEACQLIEQPVRGFALQYEPVAKDRVLSLTQGHPFLVQLLCYEIVSLKNKQSPSLRGRVCLDDVEVAVQNALNHSSFFFTDIEQNQITLPGRKLLHYLANQGEGVILDFSTLANHLGTGVELDQTLRLLTKRDIIQAVNEGYCFQVELIRRWFAK